MAYEDGQCSHPMTNEQTKMVCCCSMGEAWGEPCLPCPTPRSREYPCFFEVLISTWVWSSRCISLTSRTNRPNEILLICGLIGFDSGEYIDLCGTQPGLIVNPITNQTEEIDECKLMPTMCNHGACMNTPGSFECHCNRGFSYDIDGHQCIGNFYICLGLM